MADQNIDFRLNTQGDTSGAEEVEKSIFRALDASEEASKQADVATAKARQAAQVQREQADSLREIADAQQRIIAAKLADTVGQISQKFMGLSPEVDLALSSTQNFLGVLATTGDPIKASMAVAASAISAVIEAYNGLQEVEKKTSDQTIEWQEKKKKAFEAYAKELSDKNLKKYFEDEAAAIEQSLQKLQARARILGAKREADAAIEDATGPAASPDQQVVRDRDRALAEIQANVDQAARIAASAAEKATNLSQYAAQVAARDGDRSDEALQAYRQRDAAIAQAESAKLSADEIAATAVAEKQKITAAAAAQLSEIQTSATDAITKNAQEVKKTIEAVVTEQQGKVGADTRGALEGITQLLQDSQITPEEVGQLQQYIKNFRGSQDAIRSGVTASMDLVVSSNKEILDAFKARDAQIVDLKNQLQNLNREFNERLSQATGF